nr:hypothetical protein [Tanacetum cinerariifolium]
MGALVNKRRLKRGPDEAKANAPPKVPRKDYVASHLSQSTLGGKSLAAMGIGTGSTVFALATQETPVHVEGVSDPDPLSFSKKAIVTKDPDFEKSASFTSMVRSPGSIYQPGWGVTNNCHLDTPAVCRNMVDHIVPPGYFLELRHLPNDEFLNQYNTTLAWQVAMGSQLREKHIKNLEVMLEAEADMKDIAEDNNVELVKELESLRVKLKAAFEEFKKYEDDRVSSRCVEINARLDAMSIDFDEELYPHMLTAIAGRRSVIRHGLRLAIMKWAQAWEEHEKAKVDLAVIEAYDPEADTKYVAALYVLKGLKYPLVDQWEKLKDAPIDVIMSSLYLESDSGEDAPQLIRELCPSSSQLKILVYPEVRNPKDP